jgi:hypothetical protein
VRDLDAFRADGQTALASGDRRAIAAALAASGVGR